MEDVQKEETMIKINNEKKNVSTSAIIFVICIINIQQNLDIRNFNIAHQFFSPSHHMLTILI